MHPYLSQGEYSVHDDDSFNNYFFSLSFSHRIDMRHCKMTTEACKSVFTAHFSLNIESILFFFFFKFDVYLVRSRDTWGKVQTFISCPHWCLTRIRWYFSWHVHPSSPTHIQQKPPVLRVEVLLFFCEEAEFEHSCHWPGFVIRLMCFICDSSHCLTPQKYSALHLKFYTTRPGILEDLLSVFWMWSIRWSKKAFDCRNQLQSWEKTC